MMTQLKLNNPFNAPVFFEKTVSTTMDVSRALAAAGEPHGTIIIADFQEAGRGRIRDRTWDAKEKENLLFTILLRYANIEKIPSALSLRTGLAVSLAIEDFAPALIGRVKVKWPNDVLIDSKKVTGILCEADGGIVHIGIGINVAQTEFPAPLNEKATSIALAANGAQEDQFILLEKIIGQLFTEFETMPNLQAAQNNEQAWKVRLEERLYKKGEQVVFYKGAADSGKKIEGCLSGIGNDGELLIIPNGKTKPQSFFTGELRLLPAE